MKSFDTISGISRTPSQAKRGSFGNGLNTRQSKQTKSPLYYFYRSLRVVILIWVVTVAAITATPWLDYWVESAIHPAKTQVLGTEAPTPEASVDLTQPTTFKLKSDKVDISAPIIEGISEDSLRKGIGHHSDSVWPNQKGNVVLAGHNTDLDPENPYARVFLKLRDVSMGDSVTISYQGRLYIYSVFRTQTVKSDDTTLFGQVDDWILTFYTCDPPYTDWKRLVFQAKLEKID